MAARGALVAVAAVAVGVVALGAMRSEPVYSIEDVRTFVHADGDYRPAIAEGRVFHDWIPDPEGDGPCDVLVRGLRQDYDGTGHYGRGLDVVYFERGGPEIDGPDLVRVRVFESAAEARAAMEEITSAASECKDGYVELGYGWEMHVGKVEFDPVHYVSRNEFWIRERGIVEGTEITQRPDYDFDAGSYASRHWRLDRTGNVVVSAEWFVPAGEAPPCDLCAVEFLRSLEQHLAGVSRN